MGILATVGRANQPSCSSGWLMVSSRTGILGDGPLPDVPSLSMVPTIVAVSLNPTQNLPSTRKKIHPATCSRTPTAGGPSRRAVRNRIRTSIRTIPEPERSSGPSRNRKARQIPGSNRKPVHRNPDFPVKTQARYYKAHTHTPWGKPGPGPPDRRCRYLLPELRSGRTVPVSRQPASGSGTEPVGENRDTGEPVNLLTGSTVARLLVPVPGPVCPVPVPDCPVPVVRCPDPDGLAPFTVDGDGIRSGPSCVL